MVWPGYNIAVAIIAIMISCGGIILGIGYAADEKRLKEAGKTILINSIINAAIVGSLIAAFSQGGIVASAMNNLTGTVAESYQCPSGLSYSSSICFSYNFLVGVSYVEVNGSAYPSVFDSVIEVLVPLSLLYTTLSIASSIDLNLGIISFGLNGALKPLLTPIGYAIDASSAALMAVEVQGFLLRFIAAIAIPLLLPVGIVLRTLYFTQRLGGAIIAIAIGLFAVFPASYLLDASMLSYYNVSAAVQNVTSMTYGVQSLQNSVTSGISGYQQSERNATGLVGQITALVYSLVNSAKGFFNSIESFVAMLIIEAFLMPAFSLIITAISIRELARILGAEVNFGRLYYL